MLDVGCRNGKFIFEISHKADIKAYGVDISPNMINVCKQQYGNIDFKVTNGEDLPFDDGSFDVLTICCVLHHLNNPHKFFGEAYRVLAKDGILIVGEPCFPFAIRKITDWVISPLIKAGDNNLFSHKRLNELFSKNRFSIVTAYRKSFKQIIIGRKS